MRFASATAPSRLRSAVALVALLGWLAAPNAWAVRAIGKSGAVAPPKDEKPPPAPKSARVAKRKHTAGQGNELVVGDICTVKKPMKATAHLKPTLLPVGAALKIESVDENAVVLASDSEHWLTHRAAAEGACATSQARSEVAVLVPAKESPRPVAREPAIVEMAPPIQAPASEQAVVPMIEAPVVTETVSSTVPRLRTVGWVLTGIGAAGLVGGGLCFLFGDLQANALIKQANTYNATAIRTSSEFNAINNGRNQVKLLDAFTYVSLGVGVAALAVGIGSLAANRSPALTMTVTPLPTGMSVAGAF